MSKYNVLEDEFEVFDLLGVKALFCEERISDEVVPEGFYKYELAEKTNNTDAFEIDYIAHNVESYLHAGTVLMRQPIKQLEATLSSPKAITERLYFEDMPAKFYPGKCPDDPNYMTIKEFLEAYDEQYKNIILDKKNNDAYWENINSIAYNYIKAVAEQGFMGSKLSDPDLAKISNDVTDAVVVALQDNYGYEFPYIEKELPFD